MDEIKLTSDPKNLKVIADFVGKILKKRKIKSDIIEEILLAVDEAATNIIKHSYQEKTDGNIKLILETGPDKIAVSIFDNGITFRPEDVPLPVLSKDIDNRRPGGLGIFLMKKFMDDVTFYFKGTSGRDFNEVRMVKYLN
ncbi:MAG: ATP-binding protein [Spirochaetes bacterium]|nr:ATP-binding protein [Spirochaetota bacterium]